MPSGIHRSVFERRRVETCHSNRNLIKIFGQVKRSEFQGVSCQSYGTGRKDTEPSETIDTLMLRPHDQYELVCKRCESIT